MRREDVKTLPIIAMTANALEEDKEAALKNGMNAHIAKPLDMDVFIGVLVSAAKASLPAGHFSDPPAASSPIFPSSRQ